MFDAVVLAGGGATRLGGVDKPSLHVGDMTLLDHVVAAVAAAARVVVVGTQRPLARHVIWCLEQPPGGGPVAAMAAGLQNVTADIVVVLAADLPWIAPAVPRLLAALSEDRTAAAAVVVDLTGRRNHLAAAWRRSALSDALERVGRAHGAAARTLFDQGHVIEVADPSGDARDCDTWDDIEQARRRADSWEAL